MAIAESDISWQVLRGIVHAWAGEAAELAEVQPLAGGCINNTLLLATKDHQRAVLKISPHRVNRGYEDEAHQLNRLREAGLPTPRVYAVHTGTLDHPHSYLLLEYMEGVDLGQARHLCSSEQYEQLQVELAEMVAGLHGNTSEAYQRLAVSAPVQAYGDWATFFRALYEPIWQEAEKHGHLPAKVKKKIWKVHERLDRILVHEDRPRLVHWDLWSTNLLASADREGRWHITAFLDPNGKYADFEAEIAYLELFHTVTPAFMKEYQRHRKLSAEYQRVRKWVYQMYPLIDHVNLFGHEYVKPLCEVVEKVGAVV